MSGGALSASNNGYYQLHVAHSEQNECLPRAGTYRFASSSARERGIAEVESAFYSAGARRCKSPPVVNPHREDPIIASVGGLGRLKAALVRVSHAVERWFHKLLGRDVTMSLVIKHNERTSFSVRSQFLPGLSHVGKENSQDGRTSLSVMSRSSLDLLHVGKESPQGEPSTGSIGPGVSDPLPVREANPLYGPTTRSTSTSTRDLTSGKASDEASTGATGMQGRPLPDPPVWAESPQGEPLTGSTRRLQVSDPHPMGAREEFDLGRDQEAGLLSAEIDFEPNTAQSSASVDSAIQESGDLYAELEAIARRLAELATEPEYGTVLADAEPSIAQSDEPRIDEERVSADLVGALIQSYLDNGRSDQWADQLAELVKASEAEDSDRKTL